MTIEEMMNKRDFSTLVCISLMNQIGKDKTGIYNIEDFENRSNEEFTEFALNEMNKHNYSVLIFGGWALTKELYHKMNNYYNEDNSDIYMLYFPSEIFFILTQNANELKEVLKKIGDNYKELSSVNILYIVEAENGIEIHYSNKVVNKFFDKKPKSIESIIKDE